MAIFGDNGANVLDGTVLNDSIYGLDGDDTLNGLGGSDILEGGAGADTLNGGSGSDTISYQNSAVSVGINLESGVASGGDATGDSFSSIANVKGSVHNDSLTGDGGANTLIGLAGIDGLNGGGGNDILEGGTGGDFLFGGTGIDTATYIGSFSAVTVNLATGTGAGGHAAGDTLDSIENLRGSSYNDILTGNGAVNILTSLNDIDTLGGAGGNDTLEGGAGGDTLSGGAGIDTASYKGSASGVVVNLATGVGQSGDAQGDTLNSIENLIGSASADTLIASDTDVAGNVLDGYWGDDTLVSGYGWDTLIGGSGFDTASYATSYEHVIVSLKSGNAQSGTASGDTLESIENLTGSNFSDTLTGDDSVNVLKGGGGDDFMEGYGGADVIDGGTGSQDRASYYQSDAGITVNLVTGLGSGGHAEGDTLTGIENVGGTNFDDTLIGDANGNTLNGGQGEDTIDGGEGEDILVGDHGDDTLSGGDGADVLSGVQGEDSLYGGAGDDMLGGFDGVDLLDGGTGFDTAVYSAPSPGGTPTTVDLADASNNTGQAVGDVFVSIESFLFAHLDDRFVGDAASHSVFGGEGDDYLEGGAGGDKLDGGAGSDAASYLGASVGVIASLANSAINSGDAAGDTYTSIERLTGSSFDDALNGNKGANVIDGSAGHDTIKGYSGNDTLAGGEDNDTLIGGADADYLSGGTGSDTASYLGATAGVVVSLANSAINSGDAAGDTYNSIENLFGSGFDDTLNGNNGANVINGGAGDDTIKGYLGNDTLTGGAGNDNFVFNAALDAVTNVDMITDFDVADDTISLDDLFFTQVGAPGVLVAGAFRIGAAAADASDRIIYNSATGALSYDADGTGGTAATLFATLDTGLSMTNADFTII